MLAVRLDPQMEKELEQLAAASGRSKNELRDNELIVLVVIIGHQHQV